MINNNSNTLSIIKETVDKYIPGCKVMLFGSRARKDFGNDSDYDFLIITKENFDIFQKRRLKSIIRKELAESKIPADILIQSEVEVNAKKQITGHILKQVLKEGVAL
ncbi:MAG: nucleotidyltransferase domain-containing protein [bacterium]